jgi:hypothetical protein
MALPQDLLPQCDVGTESRDGEPSPRGRQADESCFGPSESEHREAHEKEPDEHQRATESEDTETETPATTSIGLGLVHEVGIYDAVENQGHPGAYRSDAMKERGLRSS